ncbi:MAG: ATP-dependent helicase [Lachnospiraceae bacterium]|nr:ATP-dependent helicase [Lachnospiraceae bacterium]
MNKNLNDAQMQAVLHREGPMMVLAGPGSGKTLVITRRIENLIKNVKADPSSILVITFTKAAAMEMKERFLRRMSTEGRRVTFGTFHAVFFMILKYAYGYQAENIIREEEKQQFMRELIHSMHLDFEDENDFIQGLIAEMGLVKNSRIQLTHYYSTTCGQDVFRRIYKEYEAFLHRHRKIDFDDMLVYTYELFSQRKDILSAWQKKYQYILVDEFQDVNQIQYDIVKMLAEPRNNLFVVGDDDQSIYRFRGAKPEIMLHMPKDYKELSMVNLSYNYRCPPAVVDIASKVISHNRERFEKEICAAKKDGFPVTVEKFENQREENKMILERIREENISYSQIAVLFRTNMQARGLMEQLLEYNIPFTAKDRVPNLYEHWIAKDLFAYIRIAKGSRQRRDFLMIMNRPKRYLSRESLEEETVAFDVWQAFYMEQPWIEERIEKLQRDIREIGKMRPFAAINYIRKAIGYDEFIKEYAEYRKISAEELFDVLEELQESSRGYTDFESWFAHMEKYKIEMEKLWEKGKGEKEAVTLATFHSAKGLEFDVVHILDANEGITPYKKAVLLPEMEEERRMFYVALTRAKKKLHIYFAKHINNHEAEMSRFLMECGFSVE